jgi:hypothetical protein
MSTPIWRPSIRRHFSEDFEDRLDSESDAPPGEVAWIINIPEELENGEDVSPDYFLLSGIQAEEKGDARFEDLNFRKAAQRGSWLAMQRLAESRYHLGFFDESMRWNQRLLACLLENSPEEHFPTFAQLEDMTIEDTIKETRDNIEFLEAEGINVKANTPNDLGKNKSYMFTQLTYCLKCGTLKFARSLVAQCDDSVHAVFANFG